LASLALGDYWTSCFRSHHLFQKPIGVLIRADALSAITHQMIPVFQLCLGQWSINSDRASQLVGSVLENSVLIPLEP
jgi:hypothetical protein